MFRVWFCDLEKALAVFREVINDECFCKIEGNWDGDFIFTLNENESYIVKHDDFSVWRFVGNWRNGHWEEVKKCGII